MTPSQYSIESRLAKVADILDQHLLIRPVLLLTLFAMTVTDVFGDETRQYVRDAAFRQELDRPLIASGLQSRPLRDFLVALTRERPIAVLLDRRIDPSQSVIPNLSADYFDDGIRQLARQIGADVSVVADTLVVGPPESVTLLRTRVALHREWLKQSSFSINRQFQLLRETPLVWEDLTTPRELLELMASRYDVTIENIDEIPHDLWAAGAISDANFLQAATILLSQFDMAFEWHDENVIEIVPAESQVAISQKHRPRGMTASDASRLIRESIRSVRVREDDNHVTVTGTVEDHDRVEELIGRKPPRVRTVSQLDPNSIANRRYTLKMVRQPFGGLLQLLQQNGLTLKFDAAGLEEAGVDLKQKISMEFEQATIQQLLDEACKQVGLDYRVSGTTIELLLPN